MSKNFFLNSFFPLKKFFHLKHYSTFTSNSSLIPISFPCLFVPNHLLSKTKHLGQTYLNFFSTCSHSRIMAPIETSTRLEHLRKLMRQANVHAYIIPSEDPHQSEYIAETDARRSFISGFTGSAGLAIVTLEKAALWTDGRYFLQASQQLDKNWTLMKSGLPETPSKETWLLSNLPEKGNVGVDPWLISVKDATTLQTSLQSKSHTLVALPKPNLVDQVWGSDQPARPHQPIFPLDLKFSGVSTKDKLNHLREDVKKMDPPMPLHGILLTALDDIAWFFNLRGSDIPFNPVFFSYAYIPMDASSPLTLYLHDASKLEKVPEQVLVKPYDSIQQDLKALPENVCVLSDGRCNWALSLTLGSKFFMSPSAHPVVLAKSIKNPIELQGFRDCHIHDAVALVKYFAWLEDQLTKGVVLDEVDGSDALLLFRQEQPYFMGPSFDTISSSGPNGAIIHYKPMKPSARKIDMKAMYLCDSGGQYLNGTTDVTRTLHMGTPTDFEKRAYTRVLQGHIAIDQIVFPKNTSGYVLDILGRAPLWKDRLEFRHGIGHGVGHFLNVHEGPQGIASRPSVLEIPMKHGMTITNEPGYYHPDQFGIRIENILLCLEDNGFMKFEHVTFVPMDRRLILKDLLTKDEIDWLNVYHQHCWEKLNSLLKEDTLALDWLRKHTLPI